jgi:hypothetical protein
VPILGELMEARSSGLFWQGRYTLPLAVGVPILAGAIAARSPLRLTLPARIPVIGATVLAFCHVTDFAQTLRRYTVGYDGAIQFWNHPQWTPPISGLWLTIAFIVTIVAFTMWLVGPGADDIGTEPAAAVRTGAAPVVSFAGS